MRSTFVALLLILAGSLPALAAPDALPDASYEGARVRLAERRRALSLEWLAANDAPSRSALLVRARATLAAALRDELMPPWFGTPWAFHGTSESPGTGTIACGYFVSTVLRDAGLRVQRFRLAQQASEHIVRTLAPRPSISRFSHRSPEAVIDALLARGDATYVVGFDFHVGFVVVRGRRAEFCHSSFVHPATVTCEDPLSSDAFRSGLYVVGDVLNDTTLGKWLEGAAFETVRG